MYGAMTCGTERDEVLLRVIAASGTLDFGLAKLPEIERGSSRAYRRDFRAHLCRFSRGGRPRQSRETLDSIQLRC